MTRTGLLGPSSLVHLGSGGGGSPHLPSPEPKAGLALHIHNSNWGQAARMSLEHSRKNLELYQVGLVVSKLTIEPFLQTAA